MNADARHLSGDVYHYSVFGQHLASDLPFPDLNEVPVASPDWVVRTAAAPSAPPVAGTALGEHRMDRWYYRLYRIDRGFRLEFADVYVFDVAQTLDIITWYRSHDNVPEHVRALVLGPLLALVQHLGGVPCLHGSAVSIDGAGIALLGPKHHGKSTLSLALTLAGARLLTDDTVAVEPGIPVLVRPGVHSVRLWKDSVSQLADAIDCARIVGNKETLTRLPPHLLQLSPVPLEAIYLLRPQPPEAVPAVERVELSGTAAVMALAAQTKLPPALVGGRGAGAQLRDVAAIHRSVAVYELRFASGFDVLPEVVDALRSWHTSASLRQSGTAFTAPNPAGNTEGDEISALRGRV